MAAITLQKIKDIFAKKGYTFFEKGVYNLNIIGVRSKNNQSNSFDDVLLVAYVDENLNWVLKQFSCTTDPGLHYLANPLDKNGTLILLPGQYIGAYALGIHGRSRPLALQYEAFEQVRPMRYVRDNNRNSILDFHLASDVKNIIVGNFKTNIHRASKSWLSKTKRFFNIGPYSAGCQVVQYEDDFATLMKIGRTARRIRGNSFSYTLLTEDDFS